MSKWRGFEVYDMRDSGEKKIAEKHYPLAIPFWSNFFERIIIVPFPLMEKEICNMIRKKYGMELVKTSHG